MNAPKADRRWMDRAILGAICVLVVGIFWSSAEPGFFELASPDAKDSYYNLLVQGFRSGQLSVKRDAPPGLAKLANPYDPAANAPEVWDTRYLSYEMSYYQGKLYLYYGVTPAVVLFWPYAALTGNYLPHKDAVVIFFTLGFLVAAGLLYAVWQRYFGAISVWVIAAGTLALGLATGALGPLANSDLHEVPHSCGFAFSMLTLAAIWGALHKPKGRMVWLMLASLAYGLAIGARPSLLFGAIILLAPVVHAWRGAAGPVSPRQTGWLLLAAAGPLMLIGFGLMLYNALRFDSPFEFGWRYQLTDIQNNAAEPFSLHYLWFNVRFYFLEPIRWGSHFPFLQAGRQPPLPSNYYGVGQPYCGLLINNPLVWLALAVPLAWSGRPAEERSAMRWFAWASGLFFATSALTLCLFFSGSGGYLPDFLPALMLLAVAGILGVERALAGSPVQRRMVRWGWCLLLTYSVAFNLLAGVKARAYANYIAGNSLMHQQRVDEAIEHFQKAAALDPRPAFIHIGLGNAYCRKGLLVEAVVQFQKALESDRDSAEARYDLGCSLLQAGRLDEAVVQFQQALEIDPDFAAAQDATVNNNFAWSLATNPEASQRNGTVAVILAEGACRRTHYQVTTMVGTLAAAYAEAGRFADAIATAQKAIALAGQNRESDLLQKNQELLALYQKHQPYRESQPDLNR